MGERSADGLVRAIKAGCNTRTKPSALHFAKDSGEKHSEPFRVEGGYINMRRSLNSCRDQRENISLLASGALPEAEQAVMRDHLACCAPCRQYYSEMAGLSARFQQWASAESPLQPGVSFQARWMRAVEIADVPTRTSLAAMISRWGECLWPTITRNAPSARGWRVSLHSARCRASRSREAALVKGSTHHEAAGGGHFLATGNTDGAGSNARDRRAAVTVLVVSEIPSGDEADEAGQLTDVASALTAPARSQ